MKFLAHNSGPWGELLDELLKVLGDVMAPGIVLVDQKECLIVLFAEVLSQGFGKHPGIRADPKGVGSEPFTGDTHGHGAGIHVDLLVARHGLGDRGSDA